MSVAARRKRLQKVVHYLTAFTIFLKAFSKLAHPEGYWPLIIGLFAASAYIVVMTALHDRIRVSHKAFDLSLYAIEAAVLATVAWLHSKDGEPRLAAVVGVSAIGYVVAMIVRARKT
jgi:uncharacterized membrane protein YkvA (DUF1232 family)